MNKLHLVTISSAFLALSITASMAHGEATGVVKQRMDAMSAIGDANKSLASIARGRMDFDLDTVTSAAATIAKHSGDSLLELFVEGTDGGDSDAKAEIWQDWDRFSGIAEELNLAAVDLSKINSADQFEAAFKTLSSTCGSCHKTFRAK
ncbi:c-type cytochrome [Reinekea sp.]|jgi:cytochrome c556|uniref:c-type cytochrome n=1 Tax=Reinekea sp. TaxID=1970455 RepID=UPI0039897F44